MQPLLLESEAVGIDRAISHVLKTGVTSSPSSSYGRRLESAMKLTDAIVQDVKVTMTIGISANCKRRQANLQLQSVALAHAQ